MKTIETDEQYERALEALKEMAVKLKSQLFEGPEREKLRRIYEITAEQVGMYRRGEVASDFPYMREHYDALDVDYRGRERELELTIDTKPAGLTDFLD